MNLLRTILTGSGRLNRWIKQRSVRTFYGRVCNGNVNICENTKNIHDIIGLCYTAMKCRHRKNMVTLTELAEDSFTEKELSNCFFFSLP